MFQLIMLIANLGLAAAQNAGALSAGTVSLINTLESIVMPAIQRIVDGQGKLQDIVTALGHLHGVLTVLEQDTSLPPDELARVKALSTAAQAGITAYLDSKSGIDLSKLSPIAPIA